MKIIDLLNKIANGKEVPEKIKYNGEEYIYESIPKDYTKIDCYGWLSDYIVNDGFGRFLNDEVEILETTLNTKNMNISNIKILTDDKVINDVRDKYEKWKKPSKKIEKLDEYIHCDSLNYVMCNIMFEKIVDKINEIIDYLNKESDK